MRKLLSIDLQDDNLTRPLRLSTTMPANQHGLGHICSNVDGHDVFLIGTSAAGMSQQEALRAQ
jgi:hypothetical protein